MTTTLTILGCGSSAGVPRVAQGWGVCDPLNPRNRRLRCSVLVERSGRGGKTVMLVDTSPDLRQQLLAADVARLDAILMTHPHADHTHGIDDVRPVVMHMRKMIDIHMDAPTSATMRASFGYIFETPAGSLYPPLLADRRLNHGQAFAVEGPGGVIEAVPFRLDHGEIDALGFRFGSTAYTPDFKRIPDDSRRFLQGLDLWVVDCLRYKEHPSHISLGEALGFIDEFRPRRTVLTNLSSEIDYATLAAEVPAGIEPAYDGMQLVLTDPAA